jgi:hypothetical protein
MVQSFLYQRIDVNHHQKVQLCVFLSELSRCLPEHVLFLAIDVRDQVFLNPDFDDFTFLDSGPVILTVVESKTCRKQKRKVKVKM